MKKMAAQVEGLWLNSVVVLQRRTYHKSWLKLLYTNGSLTRSIFLKDTTRILVDRTFSCLTDILMFGTSHWTISNNSLKTRWIEAEYSRRGKYSKSHYSQRLKRIERISKRIDGSNHAWKIGKQSMRKSSIFTKFSNVANQIAVKKSVPKQ